MSPREGKTKWYKRLLNVFLRDVDIQDAGPVKRVKMPVLAIIIIIPMLVAAAVILKKYGVF